MTSGCVAGGTAAAQEGIFIYGEVLGIDLGTTNSCMSVMEGGEPKCWKIQKVNNHSISSSIQQKRGATGR